MNEIFATFLNLMKYCLEHFHYHLNCQDISDNRGDNELCLVKSSQNTVNASYLFKCHEIDVNERDLQLSCM